MPNIEERAKGKNYITDSEIDGEVSEILLSKLNSFIRSIRSKFSIHCFTKGGHSENSQHYLGRAADGHLIEFDKERSPNFFDVKTMDEELKKLLNKEDKTIFEQAVIARLHGFTGVGMYPDWKPAPGLHLDIRKENPIVWVGLNKKKLQKKIDSTSGSQVYVYLK